MKEYKSRNLKRSIMDRISRELQREFPTYADQLSTDNLSKCLHDLRSHYQKLLREIKATPSGSGGTPTEKWELFSACSFLQPTCSTDSNSSSFEMPSNSVDTAEQFPGDLVWSGEIAELVDDYLPVCASAKDTESSSFFSFQFEFDTMEQNFV